MSELNWIDYPNFRRIEFACRCSCGRADMDAEFMAALQSFRLKLGFPFAVTSGYRCPKYNAKVSSTGRDGPHTTGKAADIAAFGPRALKLIQGSGAYGFTGLGVAQKGPRSSRFVHLDSIFTGPRPNVWTY